MDAIAVGGLVVIIGGVAMCSCEGLSLVDGVYYSAVTMSSIGFGDIVPQTAAGKSVSVGLALVGMGIFGDLIVSTGNHMRAASRQLHVAAEFMLCVLIGGTLFSLLEGVPLLQSFYFIIIMSSTIGYGDIVPATNIGKIFCVIYSLWSLHCMASMVNLMKELMHGLRTAKMTTGTTEATLVPAPVITKRRRNKPFRKRSIVKDE
jgi:potassium channel subfamily K